MKRFSDLGISTHSDSFAGEKIRIARIINREIVILNFKLEPSKYPKNKTGKCLHLQLEVDGEKKVLFTGSDILIKTMEQVKKEDLPVVCKIVQEGEHYEFQ
jgi:hypothetical protein